MPRKPTASRRLVRTATGGSTSRSRSPQAATRKFLWRRRPTACGGTCSRSRAREPTPGIQPWPSDPTTRCTWPGRSMTAAPDTSTTRAARTRGGAHRRKSHRGMPMPEFRRWRSMHGGSRIWSGTGFARERRRLPRATVPSTRSCTRPPAAAGYAPHRMVRGGTHRTSSAPASPTPSIRPWSLMRPAGCTAPGISSICGTTRCGTPSPTACGRAPKPFRRGARTRWPSRWPRVQAPCLWCGSGGMPAAATSTSQSVPRGGAARSRSPRRRNVRSILRWPSTPAAVCTWPGTAAGRFTSGAATARGVGSNA